MLEILERLLTEAEYFNLIDNLIRKKMLQISGIKEKRGSKNKIKITEEEQIFVEEMARNRLKAKLKYSRWDKLFLDSYSLSYSTPEEVANYRAKLLKGKKILDVGCGAGLQSIMLSEYSNVAGFDISKERVLMASLNNRVYGTSAVFKEGNGLELEIQPQEYDLIFSDPLRPNGSKERKLEELEPNPLEIMKKYAGEVESFVFDLPPFMDKEKLSHIPGVLEYLSVGGKLSRLTLYSSKTEGRLLRATILPSEASIEADSSEVPNTTDKIGKFLLVPDDALFYSSLYGNYCNKLGIGLLWTEKRKAIFSSDSKIAGFLGETYETIEVCDQNRLLESNFLKEYGKVFFRYSPEDYYLEKKKIEKSMHGSGNLYIFKKGSQLILSKRV